MHGAWQQSHLSLPFGAQEEQLIACVCVYGSEIEGECV